MQTKSGHLTYCTNIHPGENWTDHFDQIKKNFPVIKHQLSPDKPMGIGLRLSNLASLEIIENGNLPEFQRWLKEQQAYVFTMNGFPYGGFHHTRVKEQVHAPDWTTIDRVKYTIRLFDILKNLLPEGMDGGVSTSPLSYRHWFDKGEQTAGATKTATDNVIIVVEHLAGIYRSTGQLLHLDIEPEPDGMMETGMEFIEWFKNSLLTIGIPRLATSLNISESKAEDQLKAHVCLCYDVCHFAIGFEEHREVINRLMKNGIKIGKIQISAALKAMMGGDRSGVRSAFASFNENTYLHQVVARTRNGSLLRYPDLSPALEDVDNPMVEEWRAHYHVPIFNEDFGALQSTRTDITEVLRIQNSEILTHHLEVETYTWEVLADNLKLPMQDSIIRELEWVKEQIEL